MDIKLPVLLIVNFMLLASIVSAAGIYANLKTKGLLDVNAVNGILALGDVTPWLDKNNYTENTLLNDVPYNWNKSGTTGVNLSAVNLTGNNQFASRLLNVTNGTHWWFIGTTTFVSNGAAYVQNISNQSEKHYIRISIIAQWSNKDQFKCKPFALGNVICNGTAGMTVEDLSGNYQCFVRNQSPPFNYLNNTAYCFNNVTKKISLTSFQFNETTDGLGNYTITLNGKSGNTDIITKSNMRVTARNRLVKNIP